MRHVHLSRALLAAGTALAVLDGCNLETDAPSDHEPTMTKQVASAVTATYYDFIANAPGAGWHNNDGGLPWGTDDTRGSCYAATGSLENGVSSPYLFTQPKAAADGFMHAVYTVTVPAASLNPSVTATFGFKQGASATTGVTFGLKTQINGSWVTLFSQTKGYTGALATKTADLSAYGGQTLQLFLFADAGPNFTADWAAWTDFRLVADSGGVPNGGCTIGGVNYEERAVNPAVSCQVCDPAESTSAWSIKADYCRIGGTCYAADATDNLGCKQCDPLLSQTSWTNKTTCDKLVIAVTKSTTDGTFKTKSSNPTTFADDLCASEGQGLGLPGTWKALLSDTTLRDYKDTVSAADATKPVVNLQGQQLYASWNSIFVNQVWPSGISIYQFGTAANIVGNPYQGKVWTGTTLTGVASADTCSDWVRTSGLSSSGTTGDFLSSKRKLLNEGPMGCTFDTRLGCVLVPAEPPLTIENYDGTPLGAIKGKPQRDAFAYLGLPYAAPPTGSLRLAPPAKATSWSGVRSATSQGPACPQPPLLPIGGMIGSEDCLYLNVWAPKTATSTSALPVMVYQFGGGHIFGSTSAADDWLAKGFIDGDRLAAAQNAIVVTIATRTGALGWLTDPALAANATSRTSTVGGGTSGNYGLLDAIQSLKWVKRNIAKFGGDPNKVTFFGESSGATIVCDLMASPLAKDPADNKPYFSSIIMESGFCENPLASFRQTQATPIITSIGCNSAPDKVACLRAASVQSFVNTSGPVLSFFPDMFGQSLPPELAYGLKYGPHVDGYVLPTHPRQMFAAGTHNKVPAIVGNNKDEATFFMLFMVGGILTGDLPNLIVLLTCNDFTNKTNINLGTALGTSARTLYPCNALDGLGPTKAYAQGITHLQYECPARRTARALDLGQTQNVYRYWFTHRGDNLGIFHNLLGLVRDIGASHTFEIPFIFNTHGTMLWYWPSSRERALTTAMQSYWRTFANSGNPNYSGGVNWPAYDRTIDNTLKLEVSGSPGGIQVVNGINTAKCDFWDDNFNLDGWK